jgi:hypothetical protein
MNELSILGIAVVLSIGLSLAMVAQTVNAAPPNDQVQKLCQKTNGKNPHCEAVDTGGIGPDGITYRFLQQHKNTCSGNPNCEAPG